MDILDKIVIDKRQEIDLRKALIPIKQLENSVLFDRKGNSLANNIKQSKNGVIAEFKRRSPSKAVINNSQNVFDVARGYDDAGVSGMSVLTDGKYFGGSLDDLLNARASVTLPLLRKDFVIDPYQIIEAKAFGADVILLIAAILKPNEINSLSSLAKSLNLEVLLEVHNEEELNRSIGPNIDLLGVNNRNLKTFEVSIETSKLLSSKIPKDYIKVSESGISTVEAIKELQQYGFQGFLIGGKFYENRSSRNECATFY